MRPGLNFLLLTLFMCLCRNVSAQSADHFLGLRFHHGSYITSQARALHIKDSYTNLLEAYYGRQTDGSKEWHLANGLPRTGFAVLFGNSGSREHIGHLAGALAFADWKLLQKGRYRSTFRAGGGLGFIEKPYDPETNHKNLLIGARINCLLHFGWSHEIRILPRLSADLGLSFTHLSNGRSQLPNLGLNIPALTGGIRYAFDSKDVAGKDTNNIRPGHKALSFLVGTSIGLKQSPTVGSPRYLVNLVQLEAGRQFAPYARYGAGLLLSYDRSTASRFPDTLLPYKETIRKEFNTSIYLTYEQLLGRLTIPVQLGVYLLEQAYGEAVYQSFGVRYRFGKHLSASIQLKTHFGTADYIHYGLNYRF